LIGLLLPAVARIAAGGVKRMNEFRQIEQRHYQQIQPKKMGTPSQLQEQSQGKSK
jgi:hypothetical protein